MEIFRKTVVSILLVTNLHLFGQEAGFPFMQYYTPKEYGGSSQVWCAVQDNRGVMYFGDNEGIIEFDGSTWKRIYTPSRTIVRALAVDSLGRIYVGSFDEFGYLKPDKSGNLEYTSLSVLFPENERKFQDIHKIIVGSDKVYYFARNNIYIYNVNKLKTIKAELFASYAFQYNNDIYAIHKNKGICLIHDSILEPVIQFENSIKNLISIISFPDNKILIPDTRTNWKFYDLTTKQFEKFETPAQKYINEHGRYSTSRIDENKFAVATRTGGVVISSNTGEIIQVLNEDNGLPAGSAYSISTDNLGNLWICMEKGICKIDINYPATISGKLQNMNEYVLSACSYNGIQYIGSLSGIYYLPENATNKNYNPVYRKIGPSSNSFWDITTMNNFIIAGGGNYLTVLKDSSAKILLYLNGLTSLCLTNSKNNPDILFFGVHNRLGYLRLNPKATFENVKILEEWYFPEIDDVIYNITEDNDGNLWVSTQNNGIYFIRFLSSDVKNCKITHLSTNNGLPDVQRTRTFIIDSNIFVTTNNGIVQANLPNANEPDSLIRFTYTNFFGTEIQRQMESIIKVDKNNYLLSGESILNITKTPQGFAIDSVSFNRLINNFALNIPFLNKDRTISFGASDAYIHYDTRSKRDFSLSFPCAIRKVIIGNDSTLFGGSYYSMNDTNRMVTTTQPEQFNPVLDYQNNSVTISFAGLFYEDPQEIEYQYKLEGRNEEWTKWDKENKAVYTDLREGSYSFKVRAKNIYGVESNIAEYSFRILPPFYRTWLAYVIYLVCIIAFIWLIVKLFTSRITENNKALEKRVAEQTEEIILSNKKLENRASL